MKSKKKSILSNFKFTFDKKKERLSSSTVLIKGSFITCIILSVASGFIDLAFFSGLSKSLLHLGTIPMYAAVLYTLISCGMISAKFWCAMKIGMIRELRTRLEARGKGWANRLDKALIPWHIAHKFLIAVSIITALSLSVNSIGAAMKDAERNATNITISIDELTALKNQKRSDNQDKRSLTRGNLEGVANSKQTAEAEASRYWPDIERWQNRLRDIDEMDISDEEKTELKNKERTAYVRRAPTFISSKNIDYISRTELVTKFQTEAKKSDIDSESIKAYDDLTAENNAEIRNTILALENLYKHPNSYENGTIIEGKTVSFLDENGEPIDITQVIGILQGLREEWKSNTDIGESSQIFMLISEMITSKSKDNKSSGSGVAEMLMMIFIAIAGIVQEFLIAIFTPKAAIDRKLLSQVSSYLLWESKEDKERFLISVYSDYVSDGIISREDFDFKCKKCVELMEETEDDIVEKYSKKRIKKDDSYEKAVKEIEDLKKDNNILNTQLLEKDGEVQDYKFKLAQSNKEIEKLKKEVEQPKRTIKQERKIVEEQPKGFSDKVEEALKEAEAL